ncbi:MAG: cell division protein ZapB [Spirochaetaceae bacterium]|jgi:hypothetical protein|nr:cell division protein ZapB [Spirochaetaceae bacterium]
MVSIDQVRLLESRITKLIGVADQIKEENLLLKSKLDSVQKRADELEVLMQRFKDDQVKIEESIISALDRLNKFEDGSGAARIETRVAEPPVTAVPQAAEEHSAPAVQAEPAPADAAFVLKDTPYNPEEDLAGQSGEPSSAELDIF